ncbi:innexin unc-9-like [Haliotis cracherodii]|uniref:innexin unc-9-like n=1 Tax=Haliotis cracherodii TaxID=6455 RepID=UPI0039E8A660
MLKQALDQLAKLSAARSTRDDDLIDQLHHYVAVGTLLALAVLVGAKSFVGAPINCWVPKEYDKDHFQDYVNAYCWISDMYNVPFSESLPVAVDDRMSEDRDVSFYRWVIVMFMIQAFMFEIPHLIWKTMKGFSGINMEKIVGMTLDSQMQPEDDRDTKMRHISIFIDRWLKTYRRFEQNPFGNLKNSLANVFFCFGKRSGCYLTRLYLFVKLLYFINVVCQFQVLTSFLGFNYWGYGGHVLELLADDSYWVDLHNFPRIGMCDFQIRQLQNVQTFTVQCVLSINLFLEKIYAAQWFVLLLLSLLTLGSLVSWTVEEVFTSRREKFLNKYLFMLKDGGDSVDLKLFKKFVRHYLRDDGIFLLRVVGNNTSDIMTFDLLKHLWAKFKKEHHKSDDEFSPETKSFINSPSV